MLRFELRTGKRDALIAVPEVEPVFTDLTDDLITLDNP